MRIGVRLKIDVTNIDKEALFKGKKGIYLDATAFIDLDIQDQWGNNGMITQDMGKDSKEKGPILGNSKLFWSDSGNQNTPQQAAPHQPTQQFYPAQSQQTAQQPPGGGGDDWSEDIPFSPYEKELY